MNTGFQLFQLQTIDSEIDAVKKRISEIELAITNNKVVEQAQKMLDQGEAAAYKIKTIFNDIDHDIQQKSIKKSQSEANLYSGKVTNPKELQDIQQEIASLKKFLSELDDKLMEALVSLEEAETKVKKQQDNLKQAKSQFETDKSMLVAERNKLDSSLKNLDVKRTSVLTQIKPENLETYDRLRESKHGFAVSKLQDDSCSACGSFLTAGQCQQARSPSQLFFCPNCGRIVYGS